MISTPESPHDAIRFLLYWSHTDQLGVAFHCDTPAADYVRPDGSPLFTEAEAEAFDDACSAAVSLLYGAPRDAYSIVILGWHVRGYLRH